MASENDEPLKSMPIFKNNKFSNPWSTWSDTKLGTLLKWKFCTPNNTNIPADTKELDKTLPVHQVTDEEINTFCAEDTLDKIRVMWIGHATCLVNMQNCMILVDPVFSERCSMSQSVGPKRFRPVPITIDRIPKVDAVVISHNHYDHLDHGSVMGLHRKFSKSGINWFVGLKSGEWFRSCGITANVHELNWWESKEFKGIQFVFTPAQHWCARGLLDRNNCLWGSWSMIGKSKKLFFAGDTGYCSAFKEIGDKFGGFDVSLIPIGAYEPRFMMETQHVDPEQAVEIHMDVKSTKSLGIHWGTFALANEFYLEPKSKLREALEKFGLNIDNFITVEHGKTFEV